MAADLPAPHVPAPDVPAPDRPPLLLALDTSTAVASVALFDGGAVLAETTWLAGREHSAQLLWEVEWALARAGRGVADLTGLVVARGPGSFTGVRVALSVAKGIAAGLVGVPLWGVSTLEVVARGAVLADLPVRAVVDAGRGRVATALFRDGAAVEEARGVPLADLERLDSQPTLLIGDLPAADRERLAQVPHLRVASAAASLRRAGHLAAAGWERCQRREPGDPRLVDAIYLTR